MAMNKQLVKNVTKGKSTKTVMYFKEAQEDGFAMISSKLIRTGKMAEIGGALSTLLALVDSANTVTGQCNPSIQKISLMTGKGERAIIKDINKLADLGYIEKIEAVKVSGKHKYTNNYIITIYDALEDVAAPERVEKEETTIEEVKQPKKVVPNPLTAAPKNTSSVAKKTLKPVLKKQETVTTTKLLEVEEISKALRMGKAALKKMESKEETGLGEKHKELMVYVVNTENQKDNYNFNGHDPLVKEIALCTAAKLVNELGALNDFNILKQYAYEVVQKMNMETFEMVSYRVWFNGIEEKIA